MAMPRGQRKIVILLWLIFFGPSGIAQQPDWVIDELFPVSQPNVYQKSIQARVFLYSDGENLTLTVRVKDPILRQHTQMDWTDHVRIWLALPQEVYPERFEYPYHPAYITAFAPRHRGGLQPRFFSMDQSGGEGVNLRRFVEQYEYPYNLRLPTDSILAPQIGNLTPRQVHYGMVAYALFPDGRAPVLVNRAQMSLMEQAMNTKVGTLDKGITYTAQKTERKDGYLIDAQISLRALGFVQLPEMKHLRVLVEIMDVPASGKPAQVLLATQADYTPAVPSTFSEVFFKQPLQTNKTRIPDEVFFRTSFFPVFLYSQEKEWIPTGIDVDGLVYLPQQVSQSLTEVKFYTRDMSYRREDFRGIPIETLSVGFEYVNRRSHVKAFTLIHNEVLQVRSADFVLSDTEEIKTGLFSFPDGHIGLVSRSVLPLESYRWGGCAPCQQEEIRITRITPYGKTELLKITQLTGPVQRISVRDFSYQDYGIESLDWIREGEIIVLSLNHRYSKQKVRIKISWQEDGSDVEVEKVD